MLPPPPILLRRLGMATEEQVEEKIEFQYMRCRKDYYKTWLKLVLGSLGTIIVIVGSIVLWSYEPMRDITVLKMEVKSMQEKLDLILKFKGGIEKKEISDLSDNYPARKHGTDATRRHE
jgi:hypothetical protein